MPICATTRVCCYLQVAYATSGRNHVIMQSSCNRLYLHVRMATVISKRKICQDLSPNWANPDSESHPVSPERCPGARIGSVGHCSPAIYSKLSSNILLKAALSPAGEKPVPLWCFPPNWHKWCIPETIFFYWLLAKEVLNVWTCPSHFTIRKSRKVFWCEIAKVSEWTQTALLRVFRSLFTASPTETQCTESHVLISLAFVRWAQKTWQT